jgi:soluble lytic murein transglycosylase-like protein
MRRHLILLLAGLACAAPAHAMYQCSDEWGRVYMLPLPVTQGAIKFTCVAVGAATTAGLQTPVQRAEPVSEASAAADAFGFGAAETPRQRVAQGGRLAMVVDARPTRVRREASASSFSQPTMNARSNEPMEQMIAGVARQYGHDVNLLKAIIHVESRFNPNALSPKGAIGLMQVMPATGSRVGVEQPKRALFDPEMNLHAGARYLRILLDMFSDRPELAIAAYNAGEGAVLKYRRSIPPYPETQSYVRQVMERYRYYQML